MNDSFDDKRKAPADKRQSRAKSDAAKRTSAAQSITRILAHSNALEDFGSQFSQIAEDLAREARALASAQSGTAEELAMRVGLHAYDAAWLALDCAEALIAESGVA